jgi:hypothetical protein
MNNVPVWAVPSFLVGFGVLMFVLGLAAGGRR